MLFVVVVVVVVVIAVFLLIYIRHFNCTGKPGPLTFIDPLVKSSMCKLKIS